MFHKCLSLLSEEAITYENRVKLLKQIGQFTLSVESHIYDAKPSVIYRTNIFEAKKYTPIAAIECLYDEMGFKKTVGAGYGWW